MPASVLCVENLTVRYGSIEALRDVSFDLQEGEIVAMIGPNGAGKSSCVNALVGLVPSSGNITLRGQRIDQIPTDRMIARGLSLVPEGRRIFPHLTVQENLIAGGVSRRVAARRVDQANVLALFPVLRDRLGQLAITLSGGEQQMLAIGRALMGRPSVLLMDEPSLGLAPQIVDEIFRLIAKLRDDGVSILLVEQNAERAIALSDRTIVMSQGRLRPAVASADLANITLSDLLYAGVQQ